MKIFATAMVLCLSGATGFAQCPATHVSAKKEAHLSSAVVKATVTSATPMAESWDFLDGIKYTVVVNSKLHGRAHANRNMTVFSENIPGDLKMQVGEQYVLYLQPKYDRLRVDSCGNSHATEEMLFAKQTEPPAGSSF